MTELVLKHILKFIEMLLKDENDFEISEFYQPRIFEKIEIWWDLFENSKISGKL